MASISEQLRATRRKDLDSDLAKADFAGVMDYPREVS